MGCVCDFLGIKNLASLFLKNVNLIFSKTPPLARKISKQIQTEILLRLQNEQIMWYRTSFCDWGAGRMFSLSCGSCTLKQKQWEFGSSKIYLKK